MRECVAVKKNKFFTMDRSQKLMLPIWVTSLICSTALAFIITGIAHLEFHFSRWASQSSLPLLSAMFKTTYPAVWMLPVSIAIIGFLSITRRIHNTFILICYLSAIFVLHFFWLLFFFTAIYLANQTFRA